jgi:hypothetical protein
VTTTAATTSISNSSSKTLCGQYFAGVVMVSLCRKPLFVGNSWVVVSIGWKVLPKPGRQLPRRHNNHVLESAVDQVHATTITVVLICCIHQHINHFSASTAVHDGSWSAFNLTPMRFGERDVE